VILVAGGTGRLGAELVPSLRSAGLPVRVLTRDPARAGRLRDLGAEVVVGDVRKPATLGAATSGVTTVVSAIHGFAANDGGTPARVDRDGNAALVDAAAAAGARVVLLSVLGAAEDHPLALFRMKAAAEHHLRSRAHRWTIVRSAPFGELQLELLCRSARGGGAPVVLGRGENPVNVVSVEDVAAAVVSAASGEFAGRVLDVAGPEDLTLNQLAHAAQRRLGRTDLPLRHVPRRLLRVLAATQRLPRIPLGQVAALAVALDTLPMTYDALHDETALSWRGTRKFADPRTSAAA
jgi:NADH dehydrogenase